MSAEIFIPGNYDHISEDPNAPKCDQIIFTTCDLTGTQCINGLRHSENGQIVWSNGPKVQSCSRCTINPDHEVRPFLVYPSDPEKKLTILY